MNARKVPEGNDGPGGIEVAEHLFEFDDDPVNHRDGRLTLQRHIRKAGGPSEQPSAFRCGGIGTASQDRPQTSKHAFAALMPGLCRDRLPDACHRGTSDLLSQLTIGAVGEGTQYCSTGRGSVDDAITDFTRAIECDPQMATAWGIAPQGGWPNANGMR